MQATVVDGGRNAFNSLVYNAPDQNTLAWLSNNINQARETLGNIASNLVDTTVQLYNNFNSDVVLNAAKGLLSTYTDGVNDHTIYSVGYDQLCSANYIMQQYVMANPVVQELVADNMCVGYETTYYDKELGISGRDRCDFQRVDDGVLHMSDTNDECYINYYSNTDDEPELPIWDKFSVLETWEQAELMVLNGSDPTDPDGGEL